MAKLPDAAHAIVETRKLTHYLLSLTHPDGGPKAKFLMRFGFSRERPEALRLALLSHARENEVSASYETEFGIMFEIEGRLTSPDGRDPLVRVVWMIDTGTAAPRLITLVPLVSRRQKRT